MNFWTASSSKGDKWGLLSRLLSRSKIHFPSIVPHSAFIFTGVVLKGLCILEVPSRVLWPRGIGPNAATEEMSQLEPTPLFHVLVHCYGTVWTVLCSDNLLFFLTSGLPGKVEGRAVYLEVCFPAFPAKDMLRRMWIRGRNLGTEERDSESISMSKGSCGESWRCPAGWSYPVLSPLGARLEETEPTIRPRQLSARGTRVSSALGWLACGGERQASLHELSELLRVNFHDIACWMNRWLALERASAPFRPVCWLCGPYLLLFGLWHSADLAVNQTGSLRNGK